MKFLTSFWRPMSETTPFLEQISGASVRIREKFLGPSFREKLLGPSFWGSVSGSTQFLCQISGATSWDKLWGQVSGDQCLVVLNSCGKFQGPLLGTIFGGKFLGNSVCVARAWSKFRGN